MTEPTNAQILAELGIEVVKEKPKSLTALEERIVAGFEDIQRFVDEYDRVPMHGEDRDIFERIYAARLDQIRKLKDHHDLLKPVDHQNLLKVEEVQNDDEGEGLDNAAILAELGIEIRPSNDDDITNLRNVKKRSEVRVAANMGTHKPCLEFEVFKSVFEAVRDELKGGMRQTRPFKDDASIAQGNFFILSGQVLFIAEMGEIYIAHERHKEAQLRVIYDNGTESDIKMRSLQRALNKDENGRRITDRGAGPLFSGQPGKEEDFSGIVYVCRSNSTHPHIVENRDLIHKIGVTKTSVEQRMANAENDPTFLLAGVEVVATYRLYAVDRNKVEKLLHQFFDQVRMDVEIKDRFNKPVEPREWFNVPLHCIEEAVSKLIDQTIVNFKYDPNQAMLVPIN